MGSGLLPPTEGRAPLPHQSEVPIHQLGNILEEETAALASELHCHWNSVNGIDSEDMSQPDVQIPEYSFAPAVVPRQDTKAAATAVSEIVG